MELIPVILKLYVVIDFIQLHNDSKFLLNIETKFMYILYTFFFGVVHV